MKITLTNKRERKGGGEREGEREHTEGTSPRAIGPLSDLGHLGVQPEKYTEHMRLSITN